MKFKIVKQEETSSANSTAKVTYYIKERKWLFWFYVRMYYYGWSVKAFDTIEDAEHYIKYFLAPKAYKLTDVKEVTIE